MKIKLFILIMLELCLAANLVAYPSDNVYCVVVRFNGCSPVNGKIPWPYWYCQIETQDSGFNGKDYKLFLSFKSGQLWPRVWETTNGGGAYTTRYLAYNYPLIEKDSTSGLKITLQTTEYGYQLYAGSGNDSIYPNMGTAAYFLGGLYRDIIDGNTPANSDRCSCDIGWYIPPWTAYTGGMATLKTLTVDFKVYASFAEEWPSKDCNDLKVLTSFWLIDPN
jgi:hypothetical protein